MADIEDISADPLSPRTPVSYTIDVNTTDAYQEFPCQHSTKVNLQVSGAIVYIGFGLGVRGAVYPPQDEVYLPVIAGLDRRCDRIRVKSYALGVPANVKIIAMP